MLLRDIMTRAVEVIHPEATLQEAAERMRKCDVGFLPVCDQDRVFGVVTDRDITVRSTAEGHDAETTAVRVIMTDGAVFCYEDDEVSDAAALMEQKQVRRLLVLDQDQRLAGVVSLGDMAVEAGDDRLAGRTLSGVSEPCHSVPG